MNRSLENRFELTSHPFENRDEMKYRHVLRGSWRYLQSDGKSLYIDRFAISLGCSGKKSFRYRGLLHLADDLAGSRKALNHLLAFFAPADGVVAFFKHLIEL